MTNIKNNLVSFRWIPISLLATTSFILFISTFSPIFDENSNDVKNWFGLSIEVGLILPIAYYFARYFYRKEQQQALSLIEFEDGIQNHEKVSSQNFMYNTFNLIHGLLSHSPMKDFKDYQITIDRHPVVVYSGFQENAIKDLTNIVPRLRCIPSAQAHKACERVEEILKLMDNYTQVNRMQNSFDFRTASSLNLQIALLENSMEIEKESLSSKSIREYVLDFRRRWASDFRK